MQRISSARFRNKIICRQSTSYPLELPPPTAVVTSLIAARHERRDDSIHRGTPLTTLPQPIAHTRFWPVRESKFRSSLTASKSESTIFSKTTRLARGKLMGKLLLELTCIIAYTLSFPSIYMNMCFIFQTRPVCC